WIASSSNDVLYRHLRHLSRPRGTDTMAGLCRRAAGRCARLRTL
ncbi:MAG: hypothetical protein AVDCRST_MAG26-4066, partial [uncultured Chloroflexia bacterium]